MSSQTTQDSASLVPAATRTGTVDGRRIGVFDGLIEPAGLAQYLAGLSAAAFTRTERARPETDAFRHWSSEMPLHNLLRLPLWNATLAALATLWPGASYRPYRSYTNFAAFGDMLFTHTDAAPNSDEITALWYLCEKWDVEWGGETLFFNSAGDAEFVASPKPGRLALFDARLLHVGRPPNRICYEPRYTFAIKLERFESPR